MKFLTLLRKELREILPWILLGAITLLIVGSMLLQGRRLLGGYVGVQYCKPGETFTPRSVTIQGPLLLLGSWVLGISIALGVIVGIRQFWIPYFTKTWPFLLHRSLSRSTILAAKLAAVAIGFCISVGLIWTILFRYVSGPEVSLFAPPSRMLAEGWLFILVGLIAYLGTALSGLSTARWYTTRIFGMALAAIIFFATIMQWKISWSFAALLIGAAILLIQVFHTFSHREF